MSNLSIRIDKELKKEANLTLKAMGLDMSTAVKMFLAQVVRDQSLPFTPNIKSTKKALWDKEIEEAILNGVRIEDAADLFK